MKTFWSDGDNNVLANTFQHLRTGDNERVLRGLCIGPPVHESLLCSGLLDRVRPASSARLITPNIVTGNQNTVTRDNITRFQMGNIADKDVLRKNWLQDRNCSEDLNLP